MNSKHHSILGVDISSSSVKILELSHSGDQYWVEGYGSAALPDDAMEGSAIKNTDAVANTIKKILLTSQFKCKQAAFCCTRFNCNQQSNSGKSRSYR